MIDDNAKFRKAMQRMANSMRTVFYISLMINIYDIYRFFNTAGEVRKGVSISLGIIGTILIWQFGRELRAGKKEALSYWLAAVMTGMIRWIFVDATFTFSIFSILILALSAILTLRVTLWTRSGLLT